VKHIKKKQHEPT